MRKGFLFLVRHFFFARLYSVSNCPRMKWLRVHFLSPPCVLHLDKGSFFVPWGCCRRLFGGEANSGMQSGALFTSDRSRPTGSWVGVRKVADD